MQATIEREKKKKDFSKEAETLVLDFGVLKVVSVGD